ncbi:MAG: RdgB/HAM1 family non-canonical purine NTP pyrophosphatase [Saprospiraceae bacterium]|nr:RdgB/HAM1 family non-canonical purine NTP pyrophosphatase [Saprospiraceae bacterium]
MKQKILVASHNEHKIEELKEMLGEGKYHIESLSDIGWNQEIIEDGVTMEENAWIKTNTLVPHYDGWIIGEDSGLEIDALEGRPGVYTARYAGKSKDPIANMTKVLQELIGLDDRTARFRTVIAFYMNGKKHTFQGTVEGRIADKMRGDHGFGYDPLFVPEGFEKTFAELGDDVKNSMSHRYNAAMKLKKFLQEKI